MIFLLVTALSASPAPAAEVDQFADAKAAVADLLRNPDGARFRKVQFGKKMLSETAVCGEVNGTNAYGGYVGYRRFYYLDGKAVIYDTESAAALDLNYTVNCGGGFTPG